CPHGSVSIGNKLHRERWLCHPVSIELDQPVVNVREACGVVEGLDQPWRPCFRSPGDVGRPQHTTVFWFRGDRGMRDVGHESWDRDERASGDKASLEQIASIHPRHTTLLMSDTVGKLLSPAIQ